jgi:hypothetical protein
VTALDIARELFANINGIAVFALPPEGTSADGACVRAIPDIAAVITVNDAAKSEALWRELLGIASLATGGGSLEGSQREVVGTTVQSYRLADGAFTLQFATVGQELFVASTDLAMSRALQTQGAQNSISADPAFASVLARIDSRTTFALAAHPGRCMRMAEAHMPTEEAARLRRVADAMTETVAGLLVTHSDQMLRLSARVTGVPDIGELVSQLIVEHERQARILHEDTRREMIEARLEASGDGWLEN